jgi:AcrR family transcriptional regulator
MRSEKVCAEEETLSFIEKARRAQIIACTIETIATLGYGQASLAQIAKRAGISKGVIAYHFTSKEELIHQVVVEIFTTFGSYMGSQIEAEGSQRQKLQAFIRSNLEIMRSHHQHLAALLEIWSNARPTPTLLVATHEGSLHYLEALLSSGQSAGEFRPFSVRIMARMIRSAIDAEATRLATQADFDLDAYIDELTTLFDRATRAD